MSSLGAALQRINQLENTLTALGYPRCMCHPIEDDSEHCLPSPSQWLAERDREVDLRGLPGWNSLVTVVLNDPPTTTTEYGTRDVHAPDAPVFNTDMSLDQIKYYYRTRAADCQDYEIVQREVTQHYGPWTVYDQVEPYGESKR